MALIGTFEKRITNRNRHNNERLVRNEKVRSSSLLGSTILFGGKTEKSSVFNGGFFISSKSAKARVVEAWRWRYWA